MSLQDGDGRQDRRALSEPACHAIQEPPCSDDARTALERERVRTEYDRLVRGALEELRQAAYPSDSLAAEDWSIGEERVDWVEGKWLPHFSSHVTVELVFADPGSASPIGLRCRRLHGPNRLRLPDKPVTTVLDRPALIRALLQLHPTQQEQKVREAKLLSYASRYDSTVRRGLEVALADESTIHVEHRVHEGERSFLPFAYADDDPDIWQGWFVKGFQAQVGREVSLTPTALSVHLILGEDDNPIGYRCVQARFSRTIYCLSEVLDTELSDDALLGALRQQHGLVEVHSV